MKKILFGLLYLFYVLLVSIFLGFILYNYIFLFFYDKSPICIYLGNVFFIIALLILRKYTYRNGIVFSKENTFKPMSTNALRFLVAKLIPYKTSIYLLYTIILTLGQLNDLGYSLIGNDKILEAIEYYKYSIVLILACDRVITNCFKELNEISKSLDNVRMTKGMYQSMPKFIKGEK